jgi:spermidine/putrescine-binding protein
MKNKMLILLNILLLLGGLALSVWCIFMWSKIGFRLEPRYFNGNQDGNYFMIFFFVGIAAFIYAFGEFPKYSETSDKKKTAKWKSK